MQEVHDRIFVAGDSSCRDGDDDWAVVHACKSPCHQQAVGYRGSLPNTDPNYLVLEGDTDLYLNIIDPPVPLFKPQLFTSFVIFASRQLKAGRKLLIHCNQGRSRAPSLALLYLAKKEGTISDASYPEARSGFERIFPRYAPGRGIQIYFENNWDRLGVR